ncbi:hypothetical protein [Actinomadura bangladeshensis]|nr:hypothetical protein [Actinomadura bangladeshensis]
MEEFREFAPSGAFNQVENEIRYALSLLSVVGRGGVSRCTSPT